MRGALRTARYVRSWKSGGDVTSVEIDFARNGTSLPATVVKPREPRSPLDGWIALGGISRMGRQHPQLARFSSALAASGAVVVVPEVPEWRLLEMAPQVVAPTIRGCIDVLRARADVASERFGLIGFSFGAPQVAVAAAREDLADHIAGVVLFGGYCSLERTMTCALTGEHEWDGIDHRLRPDPFGGWVVGSNYLTRVAGYEDAADVAAALHRLADASSGQRIPAWDARHDALIEQLRDSLPEQRRDLFELFATPSHETLREPEQRRRMAGLLAETCRREEPLLDPVTLGNPPGDLLLLRRGREVLVGATRLARHRQRVRLEPLRLREQKWLEGAATDAFDLEELRHREAAHERNVAAEQNAIEARQRPPDLIGVLGDEGIHGAHRSPATPATEASSSPRPSPSPTDLARARTISPPRAPARLGCGRRSALGGTKGLFRGLS